MASKWPPGSQTNGDVVAPWTSSYLSSAPTSLDKMSGDRGRRARGVRDGWRPCGDRRMYTCWRDEVNKASTDCYVTACVVDTTYAVRWHQLCVTTSINNTYTTIIITCNTPSEARAFIRGNTQMKMQYVCVHKTLGDIQWHSINAHYVHKLCNNTHGCTQMTITRLVRPQRTKPSSVWGGQSTKIDFRIEKYVIEKIHCNINYWYYV